MTKPNSAAMELYICEESGSNRAIIRHAGEVLNDEVSSNIWTHFIEYSAFLKQQKIIEVLRAALKNTIYDAERLKQGEYAVEAVNNALAEADRIKETE